MKLRIGDDEILLLIGFVAFIILWAIHGIEWVRDTILEIIFFSTIVWYVAQKIHKKLKE